jgi:RNA polymerase sigma-70 factor (ECF subfamily)
VTIAVPFRRPGAPLIDEAVRLAQAGNPDAFEAIYRAHAGRVYALCLRMTADQAAAAELTQDVFVRAWEKLEAFRGESAFGSWLHRIAVNEVLMTARTARRRGEEPLGEDEGPIPPPTTRAGEPELTLDLERAIASLPPMARQVLVLHDLEGYEHAEIGGMLGIAEGTSKAHWFRARRLLRERLNR